MEVSVGSKLSMPATMLTIFRHRVAELTMGKIEAKRGGDEEAEPAKVKSRVC